MTIRPDILLISADQMRWDCLGCAGHPVIRTPNLDRLAQRGIRFANAFSPDPICVPARAAIMTGNYPQVCTGVLANGGRIRAGQPLLTSVLRNAGYRAYACGKLHFVPYAPPGEPRLVHGFEKVDLTESGRLAAQFDPSGQKTGLEDYLDYLKQAAWPGYSRAHGVGNNDVRPCPSPLPVEHTVDHWIADRTIQRIEEHRRETPGQPWFLWMSSPKPHSPYDPPRPYDNLYDPRDMPPPLGSPADLSGRNPLLERSRYTHAADTISPAAWQVIRSYYGGCITFLDAMIGRVIDYLEQQNRLDRTLILFTADHGDLLGDFGSVFKTVFLNGSARVPFLAAGPGVNSSGSVSEALVGLHDILPTFAAAAGAPLPTPVQGADLSSVLADPATRIRDRFYAASASVLGRAAMLADERWKYCYAEANATEELYDQAEDPDELRNMAAAPDCAERLAAMRKDLAAEARKWQDTSLFDGDRFVKRDVDRDTLRSLPVGGMGWRWF